MSLTAAAVTLGTTPVALATGTPDGLTVIVKDASAAVYLGGSDVDNTKGISLSTTDAVTLTLYQGDILYGYAASGSPTVRVLKTRANT